MPTGSFSSFLRLLIFSKMQATCAGCFAASQSAQSFPFTLTRPGQYTHSFQRWMLNIDIYYSGIPISLSLFVASSLNLIKMVACVIVTCGAVQWKACVTASTSVAKLVLQYRLQCLYYSWMVVAPSLTTEAW